MTTNFYNDHILACCSRSNGREWWSKVYEHDTRVMRQQDQVQLIFNHQRFGAEETEVVVNSLFGELTGSNKPSAIDRRLRLAFCRIVQEYREDLIEALAKAPREMSGTINQLRNQITDMGEENRKLTKQNSKLAAIRAKDGS